MHIVLNPIVREDLQMRAECFLRQLIFSNDTTTGPWPAWLDVRLNGAEMLGAAARDAYERLLKDAFLPRIAEISDDWISAISIACRAASNAIVKLSSSSPGTVFSLIPSPDTTPLAS